MSTETPRPALTHELLTRVAYADTDRMGVVYYGNYFALFERGRTELMRAHGVRYRDLEENDKIFLPVSEAHCRYLRPARYDALLRLVTVVKDLGKASVEFGYDLYDAESGAHLATGRTRHPFVNAAWRPVRPPQWMRDQLSLSQV